MDARGALTCSHVKRTNRCGGRFSIHFLLTVWLYIYISNADYVRRRVHRRALCASHDRSAVETLIPNEFLISRVNRLMFAPAWIIQVSVGMIFSL